MGYTGNGKLFKYRKQLYTFFKSYTAVLNWEEAAVPEEYASFNPREIYSLSLRIDENTVGYCFVMITGRRAGRERPATTNVRVFLNLDGIDYTNTYLPLDGHVSETWDALVAFIVNN